jgi:hypothetical protein
VKIAIRKAIANSWQTSSIDGLLPSRRAETFPQEDEHPGSLGWALGINRSDQ